MQSGRLRTSQLWFRIAVAHLNSVPYLKLFLIIMLIAAILAVPKILAGQQDDDPPKPAPSGSSRPPSPFVTPSQTVKPLIPDLITRSPNQPITNEPPAAEPSSPAEPTTHSPDPTKPPTTRPSQVVTSPAPAAVVLRIAVHASPESQSGSCKYGVDVNFTGTIEVDRTATVTSRWDPAEPSSDPITKEVNAGKKRTVTRRLTVSGTRGEDLSGEMKLIVTAPGAKTATATASYSITCT